MNAFFSRVFARHLLIATLVLPTCMAWAATADISNVPLLGASTGGAPPNIMVLLDTSNSMTWTHMPDQMEVPGAMQSIGYKANECNSLYYNRNTVYKIPKDSAGAALPTPDIGAAYYNYYLDKTTKVDLTKDFKAHDANTVQNIVTSVADTAQVAYYYYFVPNSGVTPTFSYNSKPCNVADSASNNNKSATVSVSGVGSWKRVIVNSTSGSATVGADERQNFANWYTYYRTRINLSKSAIGQAFQSLSNTYRVGLVTVNPTLDSTDTATSAVQSIHYTSIQDFDSAQRTLWYNNFYSQRPSGSSPAREALARVGRHFAGKTDGINTGMGTDPVQHACQRNYTIMTTDGYWNVAAEKQGLSGGPTNIAGNALVGQQDGLPGHPFTLDTDPSGLVPAGVFDGTLLQLGYTKNATETTKYTYATCNLSVPGYYTRTVKQSTAPLVKTVPPVNNAIQYQSRLLAWTQTSFMTTKAVTQYVKKTQNLTTTQYQWYDAASEKTSFVPSCSGKTNCTATINTVTPYASGSCSANEQNTGAPNYITAVCSSEIVTVQNSACTVASGCTLNTIQAPTFVANSACSAGTSAAPNYYVTTCTRNAPGTASPSTNASSASVVTVFPNCTSSDTAAGTVQCAANNTAYANDNSCTAVGTTTLPSTQQKQCQSIPICSPTVANNNCASTITNPYLGTVAQCLSGAPAGTTCVAGTYSTEVLANPASCPIGTANPSSSNGYSYVKCVQQPDSATVAGTCNAVAPTAPNWQTTICATATLANGGWRENSQKTTSEVWTYTNGTQVTQTPIVSPLVTGSCTAPPQPSQKADLVVPLAPVTVAAVTGGSTNSLADVAQYYYVNDLRPDLANLVPPSGNGPRDDRATWQHMTTFVVGLGVSGTLPYPGQDYATAGTGTFADIKNFNKSWPVWPDPAINYTNNDTAWNAPQSIDDFWHTAVNGRGTYFSATNPDSVVTGIQSALRSAGASTGSSTALTISDQINVTNTGLNFASSYTLVDWVGDVQAFDSSSQGSVLWSAKAKISGQAGLSCDDRNIYVRDTGNANKLGAFTASTKNCTTNAVTTALSASLQALISATSLTQYANMSAAQKTAATAASLVNYLRGQSQNEGFVASGTTAQLYRSRKAKLGDIVNSKPQFVGAPFFDYADEGYYTFKTDNASRKNMIYVGGNDGMLHAIYAPATTASATDIAKQGQEAWAYIPTQVIGSLSKLADNDYASTHRFYVDGTPTVGDVKFADGSWHTILVGGLRAGGKGYYALDITDPDAPRSLWEFDSSNCTRSGCSVGFTFGQPVIGKMADGTWAVFMTSGLNNSTGQASLFVVNAQTGSSIKTINAGAASASTPLGLSAISAWSDLPSLDNTVTRVYGGDLYGNIWRFDVNNATTDAASLIGIAKDATGAVQPITMPPELGKVGGKAFVYVGTGRLVGSSDFADTQQQTIYAVFDDLSANTSATPTVDLRSLTAYKTTSDLKIACATTSCTPLSSNGFLIDLIGSAEKAITPLALVGNTLVIISTQPQDNTCGSGGSSKVYFADATNGTTVGTGLDLLNTVVGVIYLNSANQTVVGNVRFGSGTGSTTDATTGDSVSLPPAVYSGGGSQEFTVPTNNQPPGVTRASWREIIQR